MVFGNSQTPPSDSTALRFAERASTMWEWGSSEEFLWPYHGGIPNVERRGWRKGPFWFHLRQIQRDRNRILEVRQKWDQVIDKLEDFLSIELVLSWNDGKNQESQYLYTAMEGRWRPLGSSLTKRQKRNRLKVCDDIGTYDIGTYRMISASVLRS